MTGPGKRHASSILPVEQHPACIDRGSQVEGGRLSEMDYTSLGVPEH
jgi:hypothetical protein